MTSQLVHRCCNLVQCCRASPIEHWQEALLATNSTTTLVTDQVESRDSAQGI